MAIYHYHRAIGKRGDGKNAVFAVAYIRGEKRTCDKTGETKDFTNKPEVIYKNTFIPEDSPKWAKDLRNSTAIDSEGKKHADISGESFSNYAWNQIEFSEKRHDSQLYFHDDIAIPNVLTQEQAIELVDDFVKKHIAINGVFCDVAIHWEDGNHHLHIVMPLRALTDTGFGKKIRRSKAELAHEVKRVRKAWADCANQKMQTLGIDERIDHRSYKDRGIDLTPTVKVGKFTNFPDQSISIRKLEENELIKKANSDAIKNDPTILSEKILQERTSFDSQTIADEIHRHVILEQLNGAEESIEAPVDPILDSLLASIQNKEGIFNARTLKKNILEQVDSEEDFARIYNAIISHENIFSLGLGEDGREHFVGRHAFDLENGLLKTTHLLANLNTFEVSKNLVREVGEKFGLNAAQQDALSHLTRSGNASIVCGYAGTGKTYMLKAAKEVWEQSGFTLVGLAMAGKAASGLESESGIASKTIYSFLDGIKNNRFQIDEKTIVVMDEMGMTSLDDMHAVMEIVHASGAKFAGVGDIEQTQPVGRGAPQRAMVDTIGTQFLDIIIRQEIDWQREATTLFETNKTAEGFDLYDAHGCVKLHETLAVASEETVTQWYANYAASEDGALKDFIMTAFKNESVDNLNLLARAKLVANGVIEEGQLISSERGRISVAPGERLLFTKNDTLTGVRNGDFATVISIAEDAKTLHVALDNGKVVALNLASYKHFTYGYAATVHKLQGHTTKDCNILIDGEGWDRHKFLVAATRHKTSLMIHAAKETFESLTHLKAAVSRHGLNDILTDFPVAFAARRGFDLKASSTLATGFIQKAKAHVFDAVGYLFNYQESIEQGQSAYDLSQAEIETRRKEAVIIAEFCDNRVELAQLLNKMTALGETGKELFQDSVYALQVRNGEIAATIKALPERYAIALERNRVGDDKVEAAFLFHERYHLVKTLVHDYQHNTSIAPAVAFQLVDNIKTHYGHICHRLTDKEARNAFLRDMEQSADIHRRDTALTVFGIENRALVNAAARYKGLDYEVGTRLKGLSSATASDKKDLYQASIARDKLAFELQTNPHAEAIIAHFGIKPERLQQHAEKYQDRCYVKTFSEGADSTRICGNLAKQAAAHRIKAEPKRYGIYIDEFLKEGWKPVNLENWLYEKRLAFAKASPELKASIKLVQSYKVAASSAYQQWQKAITRSQKNSPHKNRGFKQAQGLTWKRSLLAHEIMGSLHKHVAALAQEKVDTNKLYQQALHVDYLHRYKNETRETLKLHMAKHIHANLKDYQAGLAVFGLYQEVKELATHVAYLQRIKDAPVQEMKSLIRLALEYQDKKVEAGVVWGQAKALEKLNIDARGLTLQAKQLMMQRNAAAHNLLSACTQKDWLTKAITGINLDVVKLQREANQHAAQLVVNRYLSATPNTRGELAGSLLANKCGYHLLFDNNITFETLKKEARAFEQAERLQTTTSNQTAVKNTKAPLALWDIDRITDALMNAPIATYTAILGEPKEHHPNHLRYSGGLIVSTKGSDAGKWYSFTEEVGGTPLNAIQKYLRLSFPEALAHGASLAGLTAFNAKISQPNSVIRVQKPSPVDPVFAQKRRNNVVSAKSIWDSTVDIDNTLAARYFTEHRKVDNLHGMAIRYWPKGAVWVDFDAEGLRIEKPNKIPAAVIAARNAEGEVVSVQRIYLDEKTAGKNTFLKDAKLTKGSNQGTPGVIQTGVKGGALYIAEGPETGASIASLDASATVLTSFSVSNISKIADVIKTYAPKTIILAADNDGELSASRKTTEKACQTLRNEGLDVRIVYPDMLEGRVKTDWNDVLVEKGKKALAQQFKEKCTQTQYWYEQGVPIAETDCLRYFETANYRLDTSDVRVRNNLDFKGESVSALLLPQYDTQGLLCGETILALAQDKKTILGEGRKVASLEGFYVAQQGLGKTLFIAETPLQAKMLAADHKEATVVIARPEAYGALQPYLHAKGVVPEKVIIIKRDHAPDFQRTMAVQAKAFHEKGASLSLMNTEGGKITKLDPLALEKAHLKMTFEKLVRQKTVETDVSAKQNPQERFDILKKTYPVLEEFERYSKERKQVQGYERELIDKKIQALAKTIAKDKPLFALLEREIPQLAENIQKKIAKERGISR